MPDQRILQALYTPKAISSSPLIEPEVLMQITLGSICIPLIAEITILGHALMIPVQRKCESQHILQTADQQTQMWLIPTQ